MAINSPSPYSLNNTQFQKIYKLNKLNENTNQSKFHKKKKKISKKDLIEEKNSLKVQFGKLKEKITLTNIQHLENGIVISKKKKKVLIGEIKQLEKENDVLFNEIQLLEYQFKEFKKQLNEREKESSL